MGIQTSTLTSGISNIQATLIAEMLYAQEFATPCQHLIRKYTLDKGSKQKNVPLMSQFTAQALTEGVDIVDEEDLGITYTALTTSEAGCKVILTDKLIYQADSDLFRDVGKQLGDAISRKVDEDIITLFSALNGGTTLGADGANLTLDSCVACVAYADSSPFPRPVSIVHHPNALAMLAKQASAVGSVPNSGSFHGLNETTSKILQNFYSLNINGVNTFQDGNIDKISGTDSGYGAIFSKDAMCIIKSKNPSVERERDASLRAWEVVIVHDYGVFELDDSYGAPMRYEIGNLSTTST